jgi:AAA15 family ATPase/GTPase
LFPQSHGQLNLQQGPELGVSTDFYPSTWQLIAQQIAGWYSQLNIDNNAADIVAVIRKHFHQIVNISTESPFGVASLYATIEHKAKKIPLSLVSSGINKFIALLLAIRTFKDGVILIDEIENGVWYKILPSFWEAIHKFASANNTQLFASTHSLECLQAVAPIIDKHPKDFTLIQMSQEKGESVARLAAGADAAAAIESDIELRK